MKPQIKKLQKKSKWVECEWWVYAEVSTNKFKKRVAHIKWLLYTNTQQPKNEKAELDHLKSSLKNKGPISQFTQPKFQS